MLLGRSLEYRLLVCCSRFAFTPPRNRDCFHSSEGTETCFCCLPHFLCTGKVTLELGTKHEIWRNIVFRGRRYRECLAKRYPCTDYLDYYDWDLVSWFAERYSRLIPNQENFVKRCDRGTFENLTKDSTQIPVKLTIEESLADMQSIVRRVLSKEGTQSGVGIPPKNRRARRAAARQRSDNREMSPLRPKPIPPTQYPTWVFCANNDWNRARLVESFRPDPNYKLVWFYDGNMIRIHSHEFELNELVVIGNQKPVSKPRVSIAQIITRQIYIYMCLDGFWEYSFPRDPNVSPTLFPYHNPTDPYEPPYGTNFADVEHAMVQLINSGNLEIPTDVEKGDEMVSYIFSQSFEKRMNELESGKMMKEYSSSSSESAMSEPVVTRKAVQQAPRVSSTVLHVSNRDVELEPAVEPENIPARKSGVRRISWHVACKAWNVQPSLAGKRIHKFFKPSSLDSDQDMKDALEDAKDFLRTLIRDNPSTVVPPLAPENIPDRKSGVRGITWRAGRNVWHVNTKFAGKQIDKPFKPRSLDSDQDVKDALEDAKAYLQAQKNAYKKNQK